MPSSTSCDGIGKASLLLEFCVPSFDGPSGSGLILTDPTDEGAVSVLVSDALLSADCWLFGNESLQETTQRKRKRKGKMVSQRVTL